MRRLQEVYMLEPAGSHGVWGLDDYHCLVFVFGAAQLRSLRDTSPADVTKQELLDDLAPRYVCIVLLSPLSLRMFKYFAKIICALPVVLLIYIFDKVFL